MSEARASMIASVEARTSARDLITLTKPRVTLMTVITAGGGLWLAGWTLSLPRAAAFLVAVAMLVGAANALNCWLERDLDGLMERTRDRPLPAGRLPARSALLFGLALAAISVPATILLTNTLTGVLGAVALVSYVCLYTPMKRVSPEALLVGAVPGAMPPLMGWTAATGAIEAPGVCLFAILFLWQLPHFVAISIFRAPEYERAGMRVLPVARGVGIAKLHAQIASALVWPVSLGLFGLGVVGWPYFIAANLLGLGILVVALWRTSDPRWTRRLFFTSLAYLPLLFASIAIDSLV